MELCFGKDEEEENEIESGDSCAEPEAVSPSNVFSHVAHDNWTNEETDDV